MTYPTDAIADRLRHGRPDIRDDDMERAKAWFVYETTHPGASWEAFKAGWEAHGARGS